MKFIYTLKAEADLVGIWEYLYKEACSEGPANKMLSQISAIEKSIATYPEIGRNRDRVRKDTRSISCGNYLLFYQVKKYKVVVIRVLHASMDISEDLF
jgi:toxin ParE1/3/4